MVKEFFKKKLWFNYIICINAFVFTRYILQIIINNIFVDPQPGIGWLHLVNSIFYVLLFLCGCLAGYLINKRTILHASLITTIAIMFSIFLMGLKLSNYYIEFFSLLALGAILGGMGGAVVFLIRKFINRVKRDDQLARHDADDRGAH